MCRSIAFAAFIFVCSALLAEHPLLQERRAARSVDELQDVIERLNAAIAEEDNSSSRRELELVLISAYGRVWGLWAHRDWSGDRPTLPTEKAAHEAREAGYAVAAALLQTEKPGSPEWGKIRLWQTPLAIDDAELVSLYDIPDDYFWSMPKLAIHFRHMQFEAYCRLHQEEKGLSIACDTIEWLNDPRKHEHAASVKNRGDFVHSLQIFGQYVAIMTSQSKGPLEPRVEALERLTHIENAVVSQAAITLLKQLRERHEKSNALPTSI